MRKLTVLTAAVAITALGALPALGVHEANNKFDMAATAEGPGADATGRSNFIAGGGNGTFWDNDIDATGLLPDTDYTWVGIAGGTASEICSFTTDADGDGSCSSDVNSRLGATEVRLGGVDGATVLRATASTDDDGLVEDGEIERRGTARFKG